MPHGSKRFKKDLSINVSSILIEKMYSCQLYYYVIVISLKSTTTQIKRLQHLNI